jgi:hypothetical protein
LQNTFEDSFDTYTSLSDRNYTLFYLSDHGNIFFFLQTDIYKTYYLTISLVDLFGFILCFSLPEIQVVIIISTPAIISALVFISLILFLAKPILLVLFLNIFFLIIFVNLIILSHKLRYYQDYYPRLLY